MNEVIDNKLYYSIKNIISEARGKIKRAVNFAMVEAYWNIGRLIVEEEQKGADRAEYGAYIIRNLSIKLSADMGKGFSEQSLRNFRQFYQQFSIRSTV